MHAHRQLTICADDFALDEAVSSAVLRLAEAGRVSAVSCFADSPLWDTAGKKLERFRDRVLIGLHFNLTHTFEERNPTLNRIIFDALSFRINAEAVRKRLARQIDRFTDVTGSLPDFIDGHHHVHALPIVSGIVRRMAAESTLGAAIPIRSVNRLFGPTDAPIKRHAIRFLAALGSLGRHDGAYRQLNTAFAGDYSLRPDTDYGELFQGWLESAPDGALIMCHPSLGRGVRRTPTTAGEQEYRFLASAGYAHLLEWHAIRLLRRSDRISGAFSRPQAADSTSFRARPRATAQTLKHRGA
jgi:hypothetical protein